MYFCQSSSSSICLHFKENLSHLFLFHWLCYSKFSLVEVKCKKSFKSLLKPSTPFSEALPNKRGCRIQFFFEHHILTKCLRHFYSHHTPAHQWNVNWQMSPGGPGPFCNEWVTGPDRSQFFALWPSPKVARVSSEWAAASPRASDSRWRAKADTEGFSCHFCHILLVAQTNSGTAWEGTRQGGGSLGTILEAAITGEFWQ